MTTTAVPVRAPPLARITAFDHVALAVRNVRRAADFYAALPGFRIVREGVSDGRPYAYVEFPGGLVTLWDRADRTPDRRAAGLHHLAFRVGGAAGVRALARDFAERGVPVLNRGVVRHHEHGDSGAVYVTDPDGNRLEFAADGGLADAPAPAGDTPACGLF